MDFIHFYVSSFWVWAGITWGISIVGWLLIKLIVLSIAAIKGYNINLGGGDD